MAKSKTPAQRRPDEVEVTSRRGMHLRSPSVRRPSTKFRDKFRDGPVKPTTGYISAGDSPRRTPSPPSPARYEQPFMGLEIRQTERSRAIVSAMERSDRMKRLSAIKTPPAPRAKKLAQPLPPRHTPPRKAKKAVQPDRLTPAIEEPPNKTKEKRKVPDHRIPSEPPNKTKEKRKVHRAQAPAIEEPPAIVEPHPQSPAIESPLAIADHRPQAPRKCQTPMPNTMLPRRSPRALSKSTGRVFHQSRPVMPNFSAPDPPAMANSPPPPSPPLPAFPVSPPMSNDDEAPAPDFDPSFENNISDNEGEDNSDNVPSIRCQSTGYVVIGDEGGEKRKVRGVVNGITVANYKVIHNKGQPIKVELRPDGRGPVNRTVSSLLIHEIGSAVRDKVPMMAASFKKLTEEDRRCVYDHLSPNFVITAKDDPLWIYIFKKSTERYRDWKCDCKTFFRIHGPDVIPREFLDRPNQWKWLVSHFSEPKNQERGAKMSAVRTMPERMNHTSGKCPFYVRAAILVEDGVKAPNIGTFSHVYSKDPIGAALAKQMQDKVQQFLENQNGDELEEPSVLDEEGPIPLATELDIMTQVIGQKHGTYISGTGKSFKRPPLPRGGARNSELKDQLQKEREEFLAKQATLEDRIRVLEDLVVRGGSANINGNNISEGATSYVPAAN